jgi:hypothetical protein
MAIAAGRTVSFAFDELAKADLVVDAVYRGGSTGNAADDPLARLLPVGNQGGFRFYGKRSIPGCRLGVLFSTLAEPDWPDILDVETGRFTYYGDNRRPGHDLHDTPRGGNTVLRLCFDAVHRKPPLRDSVPPFFVFSRIGGSRDVRFRGLAVPGEGTIPGVEDLVAIWKTVIDERFQNYRAMFTILDVAVATRQWIDDVVAGQSLGVNAPSAWKEWIHTGRRRALTAPKVRIYRSRVEQLPVLSEEVEMVRRIHDYFSAVPTDFEACAVEIARMVAPNIVSCDVTRPWVDGGRDAVGEYRLGPLADAVKVEFALEAKCYAFDQSVGVQDTSRLISRLRFRQFGILVTTSWVHAQAYKEVRDDRHPVIILCARDIVDLLRSKGLATPTEVSTWLEKTFPKQS